MAFITGSGATLRIGKEETFKSGSAKTALVDITSESIALSVEKGDEGSLLASKTATSRDLLALSVDGSFSFILRPEVAALITHLALGGKEKITDNQESGTFNHEFNL